MLPGQSPVRTNCRRRPGSDVLDASATGAQLAASVSLVLAAGKIRDHVADRDGAYARKLVASGGGLAARRWQSAGERTGASIGFDTDVLTDAIARQAELERTPGLALRDVTEPTETAVSAAFAHTAILAGQPANAGPLAEAGRQFGHIAHLLDAVTDLEADESAGSYNPLLATGTTTIQAAESCSDALASLRSAVAVIELERPALTESLLVSEVGVPVDRVFRQIMSGAGFPGFSAIRPAAIRALRIPAACRRAVSQASRSTRSSTRRRGSRPGTQARSEGPSPGGAGAAAMSAAMPRTAAAAPAMPWGRAAEKSWRRRFPVASPP